ncbi:uncharacterized protein AB675_4594 [Cyphellophora attinorum]|uniref:Uncharacterized protein n=1 Tax=Cyphellophora attinorum TaxID=1664694 RepID=A0A0N1H7T2_9EURO|nr:uncharacterized protein AB675_4594 [Phialophora attinorum]KPI39195.1 hypothetical protein AB675_4594 [Phialophora attinorum]
MASQLSRHSGFLVATAATTLLIAVPAIRTAILERKLARRITYHHTLLGDAARELLLRTSESEDDDAGGKQATRAAAAVPAPYPTPLSTLPQTLITSSQAHNIFYDISLLPIPTSTLPPLLTTYLQHNMQLFSRSPQGWILWATQRDGKARRSFEREWIESLGFEVGELVNGLYTVVERGTLVGGEGEEGEGGAKVVFGMSRGKVEGRLVISIRIADGEMVEALIKAGDGRHGRESTQEKGVMVFCTETWMWVRKDARETMPMEMAVPRFMHRVLSWRLLVSGTEHLQGLAR